MARQKVTLAYISNDSERKASFKKRKNGLIKKMSEISTLCDVEACAIIYGQYDPELQVWPSRRDAEAVVTRFENVPEIDRTKKMMNQEGFIRQRIKKVGDKVRRAHKKNKQKEMEHIMFQSLAGTVLFEHLDLHNTIELRSIIDQTLEDIKSKISSLEKNGQHHHAATSRDVEDASF